MKTPQIILAMAIATILIAIISVPLLSPRSQAQELRIPAGSMEGAPGQQGPVGRYQIIDTNKLTLLDTQTGRVWERVGPDWFEAGPQWSRREQPPRR